MKFSTDASGLLKINPFDFGDPKTLNFVIC